MELPAIQVPGKSLQPTQEKHLKESFPADNPFEALLVAETESNEGNLLSELDEKTKEQKPDYTAFLPFQLLQAWQTVLESEPVWQPKEKLSQPENSLAFNQLAWDLEVFFQKLNTLEPQLLDLRERIMLVVNEFGEKSPNLLQLKGLLEMSSELESLLPDIEPDLNQHPPNASCIEIFGKFLEELARPDLETDLNSGLLPALGTKDSNTEDSKPPNTILEEFRPEVLSQTTVSSKTFTEKAKPIGEDLFMVNENFNFEFEVEPSFEREARPKEAAVLEGSITEAFVLRPVLTRLNQRSACIAYGPLSELLLSPKDPIKALDITNTDVAAPSINEKKEGTLFPAPVTKSDDREALLTEEQHPRLIKTTNQKQKMSVQNNAEAANKQKEYHTVLKVKANPDELKTDLKKSNMGETTNEPVGDRTKGANEKWDLLKNNSYLHLSKDTAVTPKDLAAKVSDSNKPVTIKEIPEIVVRRISFIRLENEVIKLKLYPRELGEVRISLNVKSEVVNLKFEFENPLSQKAVKEELPLLKEALESQGLELGEFSLGTGSFNRQGTYFSRLELAEEFSYLLGDKNTTNVEYEWPQDEAIQEKSRQDTLVDYRV